MLTFCPPPDPPLEVRHASVLSAELWTLAERRRALVVEMRRFSIVYAQLSDVTRSRADLATIAAALTRTAVGQATA